VSIVSFCQFSNCDKSEMCIFVGYLIGDRRTEIFVKVTSLLWLQLYFKHNQCNIPAAVFFSNSLVKHIASNKKNDRFHKHMLHI